MLRPVLYFDICVLLRVFTATLYYNCDGEEVPFLTVWECDFEDGKDAYELFDKILEHDKQRRLTGRQWMENFRKEISECIMVARDAMIDAGANI